MPTVFIYEGFRFFFYSNEESRMHIHVELQGREAKIWIDTMEVAFNNGFREHHLVKIILAVRMHEKKIKERWNAHFG